MKQVLNKFIAGMAPLWSLLGADPAAIRVIVGVKLTLDNRRSYGSLGRYGNHSGEKKRQFLFVLAVYTFFGLFTGLGLLAFTSREALFVPLTIFFAYAMVFCAMTLLADFSSLILDTADNQIILPRPVSSRTLLLARVVHVGVYVLAITLALSLVGLGVTLYRFGPMAALVFLLMCLLASTLMVFLTNVSYLILMQFTSEERLREVINYFQIVMAIVFYGSYQLMPRLMRPDALTELNDWQSWYYLVPPLWMAGAVDLVLQPESAIPHWRLLSLAVGVPLAGMWMMGRVLGPVFNARLASLDQEKGPSPPGRSGRGGVLMHWLGRRLTTNPLERAAFGFTWRVTARDRKFKLRTYPQLGFGLAYIIALSASEFGSFDRIEGFYLFALYYTGLFVMTAQYQLGASDDYKAAWVYGSTPISRPGEVLSGAMKALIVKLMVPFYGLVAGYVAYQFGTDKVDDILLAFSNSLVMSLATALMADRQLPFSVAQDVLQRNNTVRGLLIFLALASVAWAHYGLTRLPYGVWAALPVSTGLFIYLFAQYRQTDWAQLKQG